jgi:hypothetical protein
MLDALLLSQEMDLCERYTPVKSDYPPGCHQTGWRVAATEKEMENMTQTAGFAQHL